MQKEGFPYPELSIQKDGDAWGFLNPIDNTHKTNLDCVVLHVDSRMVMDSSLKCCKELSELGDSPFCCTSSVSKFAEFLSQEKLSTARLEGFSEVLEEFITPEGCSMECSFTTRSGAKVNLCPKASPFPPVKEMVLHVFSFDVLEVCRVCVRSSPQLEWFLHTASTDSIPLCLWRTQLSVTPLPGFPCLQVGEVTRCSNMKTAKWIQGVAKKVTEEVEGRVDCVSPDKQSQQGSHPCPSPKVS